MSADWNKIKTEYITTDISYRGLAQKYGVHKDTIGKRAKDEDWAGLRRQHTDKTQTEILNAIGRQQVHRAARLQTAADKLLGKVENLLDDDEGLQGDTQSMRDISRILKDIKEIHMIKSELDRREQEARIGKLRKEAEKEDGRSGTITVVLEGALADYGK